MVLKRLNKILKSSQLVTNVVVIEPPHMSCFKPHISTLLQPEITRFTEEGIPR